MSKLHAECCRNLSGDDAAFGAIAPCRANNGQPTPLGRALPEATDGGLVNVIDRSWCHRALPADDDRLRRGDVLLLQEMRALHWRLVDERRATRCDNCEH